MKMGISKPDKSLSLGSELDVNERLSTIEGCLEILLNLRRFEKYRRRETIHKMCEVLTFFFLISALLYSYKSMWDLERELKNLKCNLESKSILTPETYEEFSAYQAAGNNRSVVRSSSTMLHGKGSHLFKNKREIRRSDENISALSTMHRTRSDSEEFSAEIPFKSSIESLERNFTSHLLKPYRNHRKLKKYNRHTISAEKFFTETESTTTTPIQIRQSRTKLTNGFGDGKYKFSSNRKPLLHSFGSNESITREEAHRRASDTRNLIAEKIPNLEYRLKSENRSSMELSASEELLEFITYNMITVHFAADTSHYSREKDSHYFGNGRMQTKASLYKDWKPIHWTQGTEIGKYFQLNQGKVTVSITGIYLIYAQIQYSNVHEVNGYALVCNKQSIAQCITTSVHPDKDEVKSNTCDTSTTILLRANDKVYIQDLHHGRHVVLTPEKSYFGLILLSPFKSNDG